LSERRNNSGDHAENGQAREGCAEVEKCAVVCRYYALWQNSRRCPVSTDASHSFVSYQPPGPISGSDARLNFPFGVPLCCSCANGGEGLISNTLQCASVCLAIEEDQRLWPKMGYFKLCWWGLIRLIADERASAATLTGSEPADEFGGSSRKTN